MTVPTHLPVENSAPARAASICPFHDGAATLDLLLAELESSDTELFDAVLDLRTLSTGSGDAEACATQLFRVRRLLAGRHYLAFYRVRCWAHRALHVEVRAGRGSPWVAYELPLDCARIGEVVNTILASFTSSGSIPDAAHVRFVFASSVPAPVAH